MRYLWTFLLILPLALFAQTSKTSAPVVEMNTTQGVIELTLMPDVAPKAVENFIGLIKKSYYDGVIFHRIIRGFMIQAGDPTGTGRGGESIWGIPFADEFAPNVVFDRPGIVAMANAGPGTNGSQFFITVAATPWLNGHHTIFGYVSKGMDVVKKLENIRTTGRYGGDRPIEKQVIYSMSVK